MSAFDHASVLAAEVIEHLGHRDHGVYVDGTLGGAGHSAALLERLTTATLIGIDRDPSALAAAGERLAPFGDRARLVHGEYADIPAVLADLKIAQVDGILLDLAWTSSLPRHLAEKDGERSDAVCELITRKAVVAGDDEIALNARARSARLRVCERTAAANVPALKYPPVVANPRRR